MRGIKRSRDDNGDSRTSHDIRSLMRCALDQEALRRTGPFFLERALLPRLLTRGYHLTDPTRKGSRDPRGLHHFAKLSPPQRRVAATQVSHYMEMDRTEFRPIVPPNQNRTAATSAITDIVFDSEEQLALVCQPRRISAYATGDWLDSESTGALVSVEARMPSGAWSSARFAFTAAQFLGSSLHVAAAYHSAPKVDVFDLENVDEATSEPQQRFALPGAASPISCGDSTMVYANDVVNVTEHVALAALSSGLSVWLDRRSGKVEPCTGLFVREYSIGQRTRRVSGLAAGAGPLSAIAFLCCEDPINVLCGTVTGAVQLWDVRCAREYVAVHKTAGRVCRIHPSFHPDRRGLVWLNNYEGEVQGLCVGRSGGMHLVAAARCADATRSSATSHLLMPRIAALDSFGLIACPHVSSNSLLMFDTNGLLKRPEDRPSKSSSTLREAVGDTFEKPSEDDSDNCVENEDEKKDDDHLADVYMNSAADPTRGFVSAQSMFSSTPNAFQNRENKIARAPASIPFSTINYEDYPNISACAAWNKYGRFIVGDTEGRVEIA